MDGKTEKQREEEEITRPAHDLWDTAPLNKNPENRVDQSEDKDNPETDDNETRVVSDQTEKTESVRTSHYDNEPKPEFVAQAPEESDDSSFATGKFLRGFLIIALIILGVLAFLFFRGAKVSDTTTATDQETVTTNTSIPVNSPNPTKPIMNPTLTTKRLYSQSANFFENTKYPAIVTSYKDAELVGISCSNSYTCSNAGCTATKKGSFSPDNATVTQWYKQASLTTSTSNISEIHACQTATNQTILLYHQAGDANGIGSVDYVGRVESDNTVTRLVAITNVSYPNFICNKPLQLTALDLLFLQCSSGNNEFKSETIYGVNMASSAYTQIINCTEQLDPTSKKMLSSCQ